LLIGFATPLNRSARSRQCRTRRFWRNNFASTGRKARCIIVYRRSDSIIAAIQEDQRTGQHHCLEEFRFHFVLLFNLNLDKKVPNFVLVFRRFEQSLIDKKSKQLIYTKHSIFDTVIAKCPEAPNFPQAITANFFRSQTKTSRPK
jgi:hypothetical protein